MDILYVLPLAVTFSGIYFLFKLRFFFLVHPYRTLKKITPSFKEEGAFRSMALALAGTLGIGNIVGVAVGIAVGGPGAVFWLFVSSFFSMVIKYSEASLSCELGGGRGMIGVILKSFGRLSRPISYVYAILILLVAFVMGSALQSASIGQSAYISFGIPSHVTGVFLLVALLLAIIGGAKKISKITAIIIPVTTIIYIILAFSTIITNINELPVAFLRVVSSAFEPESAVGGVSGFLLSDKIKEGYLRGILSNEAGAGTSTIAHSSNKSHSAASVGLMGMMEVVFDTVILCMLTAFATLVSVDDVSLLSGVGAIISGIGGVFGKASEYLVAFCIFAFAYSTVICWYYYGSVAYEYLLDAKSGRAYTSLFLISALIGVQTKSDFLIGLTDVLLLFLSIISLFALMKNSDRIKFLSEHAGLLTPRC